MSRLVLFLAVFLVVGWIVLVPAARAQDLLECGDFTNQEAAQKIFDQDSSDLNNLDQDGDGKACERRPSKDTATPNPDRDTTIPSKGTTTPTQQPLPGSGGPPPLYMVVGAVLMGIGILAFALVRRTL